MLYDTTSLSFETLLRDGLQDGLHWRSHSKDKRPDLPQPMLGPVLLGHGLPIAHELFAGNTHGGSTVSRVLE